MVIVFNFELELTVVLTDNFEQTGALQRRIEMDKVNSEQ